MIKTSETTLFDPDFVGLSSLDGAQVTVQVQNMVRGGAKSAAAFRTISEVADQLGVQQHVLRFWETKFSQIKPLKRGGGRRYYRPEDVRLLNSIHRLLYTEGYTIKGVQKLLRDVGKKQIVEGFSVEPSPETRILSAPAPAQCVSVAAATKNGLSPSQRQSLEVVLEELKHLRGMIKSR